jgi:hypothetical protein
VIYFVGGFAALLAGMLAWRTFATMDPARLTRIVRWVGIGLLVAIGLFLLTREAVLPAVMSLGGAAFLRYQAMRGWRFGSGPKPSAGQSSTVTTDWLEMVLDHGTGETSGLVLKGRFKGAKLAELSLDDLLALRAELRIDDGESAQLLDAYLARVHPDAGDAPPPPRASSSGMTRDEALDILGLEAGAAENAIRDAHRRLMQQLHPDRGGTDYLAAKINAARDVLLG